MRTMSSDWLMEMKVPSSLDSLDAAEKRRKRKFKEDGERFTGAITVTQHISLMYNFWCL